MKIKAVWVRASEDAYVVSATFLTEDGRQLPDQDRGPFGMPASSLVASDEEYEAILKNGVRFALHQCAAETAEHIERPIEDVLEAIATWDGTFVRI